MVQWNDCSMLIATCATRFLNLWLAANLVWLQGDSRGEGIRASGSERCSHRMRLPLTRTCICSQRQKPKRSKLVLKLAAPLPLRLQWAQPQQHNLEGSSRRPEQA